MMFHSEQLYASDFSVIEMLSTNCLPRRVCFKKHELLTFREHLMLISNTNIVNPSLNCMGEGEQFSNS